MEAQESSVTFTNKVLEDQRSEDHGHGQHGTYYT